MMLLVMDEMVHDPTIAATSSAVASPGDHGAMLTALAAGAASVVLSVLHAGPWTAMLLATGGMAFAALAVHRARTAAGVDAALTALVVCGFVFGIAFAGIAGVAHAGPELHASLSGIRSTGG